jgi:hypothetical protein
VEVRGEELGVFNANERWGVEVNGIQQEVIYAPLSDTAETTMFDWLYQVKTKEEFVVLCDWRDSKTPEMGKFVFQCLEDNMAEAQEFLDTKFVIRYQTSMPD